MTNLFAVQMKDKDDVYAFCVADSQASGEREKASNVQKLVMRGKNLVMATSNYSPIAWKAFEALPNDDIPADCLAGRILEVTKDVAKKHEGDVGKLTTLFVVGPGADAPEMFEVEIISADIPKKEQKVVRGINPVQGMYSSGSGKAQIMPAFRRDHEMGYTQIPSDPTEGLLLCYSVGKKADSDLWVNERLQIGVVSKKYGTRMILPPGTQPHSDLDMSNALGPITGVDWKELRTKNGESIGSVADTVGHFYHALETMMKRLDGLDIVTNMAHNRFKRGDISAEEYVHTCMMRAQAAQEAAPYVTAFVQGGIERLANAVSGFAEKMFEAAKNAKEIT